MPFTRENYAALDREAEEKNQDRLQYLQHLIQGGFDQRRQRVIQRRIKEAHFPVIKTLEQFRWDRPKKINRLAVQNLFRLVLIKDKANVIFLGAVGLGGTHLASALGYAACQEGHSVLFANAINVINEPSAAQKDGALKHQLEKHLPPRGLVLDGVGYLPIDQRGADLLFQTISQRYERGSIILTTHKAFKQWPAIFNNDGTITSAVLDRLLHHAETIVIEGSSFRMKDQIDSPTPAANERPTDAHSPSTQTAIPSRIFKPPVFGIFTPPSTFMPGARRTSKRFQNC